VVVRMWRNQNIYLVLVGGQNGAANLELLQITSNRVSHTTPERNENICLCKCGLNVVVTSFIIAKDANNLRVPEVTNDKRTVVCPYNGILFGHNLTGKRIQSQNIT
jgi:hypothetical protein